MTSIDGILLKKMIIAGANALDQNREIVDALNVFPVPDGDTGTNMSMTTLAAAREVEGLETNNVYQVAKAASSGSLRGARGNSGVILSQLFRGFAKGLENCEIATADDIANAFEKSVDTAYKAVMKPKEGTILTVAREMAACAAEMALETDDILEMMQEVLKVGNTILKKTTEMLPALKQANVVDAGGQGLLCILEGAHAIAEGKNELAYVVSAKLPDSNNIDYTAFSKIHDEEIEFTYCTEFFINLEKEDGEVENALKQYLETMGDSIVVVVDETIIKVHVHSNNPGAVLEKALTIGFISTIKIENMRLQHTEKIGFIDNDKHSWKEAGFVAVSTGAGIKAIFENIGADQVIEGGQTMNPSADDILQAVEKVKAHNVFVFPNNKNILLAAQQAASLSEDKRILVVPSKSIPQGITALVGYSEIDSIDENFESMSESMEHVHCGQITYAVRDSSYEGGDIKEGDILCMYDGSISAVANNIERGAKQLIDLMMENNGEIITIYYGSEMKQEDAEALCNYISEKYPYVETEVQNGEQPLYYYIISVE